MKHTLAALAIAALVSASPALAQPLNGSMDMTSAGASVTNTSMLPSQSLTGVMDTRATTSQRVSLPTFVRSPFQREPIRTVRPGGPNIVVYILVKPQ